MNRSSLVLGLALIGTTSYWASAGLPERHANGGSAVPDPLVSPDVFSAQVEAREYVRNPDGTARVVFMNTGSEVHVTLCGSKNRQEATTRFPEVGPLEVRAGEDVGAQTTVLASISPTQPYFAVRFTVPAGTPQKPMNVFLWNGDRDKVAALYWRVIVGVAP